MTDTLFPELVVNGETVPPRAIAAEAQNHPAPRGKPGLAWRAAANAVAIRTLLLQEARRRRLTPEPKALGPGRFETGEEALIRALLEAAVVPEAPSEAEIRAEWARDPGRFRSPPLWEASHILVACDPTDPASRDAALVRAREVAVRAVAHPAGFAALAAEFSDCDSARAGGGLGQLRPGDAVPEFEAALRRMTAGEVSAEPVLTRHGWHVIRLDAMAEGRTLPCEAVRERIAEALEKLAWTRAARAFVAGLLASAEISGTDLKAS